ncbi:methyl-accepting chemotaxis protein [bacterium]|nr:methyl-accepting chemotaxis protein [bacterium]
MLKEIVNGHAPAWELSRNLLAALESLQRGFQDAVASDDEDELLTVNLLNEEFHNQLEAQRDNPVLDAEELDDLKTMFTSYYEVSYKTVTAMINGSRLENMTSLMDSMTEQYLALKEKLESNIKRDKANMTSTLVMARGNNRTMLIVIGIIVLLSILLLLGLSWFIVNSILNPLYATIMVAESVAEGDLTVKVPSHNGSDEASRLLHTLSKMVSSLRSLSSQIKESTNALASASAQISTSVTEIASAATETAAAATQTSTTVEEVRQTSQDSNRKAKHVSESAQKAVEISKAGQKSVSETIEGMHRIEAQMESIAESILRLSEHGQAIGGIIATVEDVAEQSRLLAVNASIEAVKAGEHGKGFAVVAQEVRNLAEQSKEATVKVRNILDDIQKSTGEAVMKTEQGSKAVEDGVKQSADTGDAIQKLMDSVAEAAQATTQIAVSSQEQLVGMDQMVTAMESIKQASNQNVTATKQVESASHDLTGLGQKLQELMGQYKI